MTYAKSGVRSSVGFPVAALAIFGSAACGSPDDPYASDTQSILASIEVTPSTDLLDGQDVRVTARGFAPNAPLELDQCLANELARATTPDAVQGVCMRHAEATTDSNGTFTGTVRARHSLLLTSLRQTGPIVTCIPDACAFSVASSGTDTRVTAPLHFRELPSSPLVVATPATGLFDRQAVRMTGSGFWPNTFVAVGQCRAAARSFEEDCIFLGLGDLTGATGAFGAIEVQPRHFVQPSRGDAFTCEGAGACVLFAAPNRGDTVDVAEAGFAPIHFENRTGPVTRGTIQVSSVEVSARDMVTVTGSGWAAFAPIRVGQCGATPQIEADAGGSFSVTLPIASYCDRSSYLTDCTLGGCGIEAVDTRDENSSRVQVAITVALPSGNNLTMSPSTPLVENLPLRLEGSGWPADTELSLWICSHDQGYPGCARLRGIRTSSSGAYRVYVPAPYKYQVWGFGWTNVDCRVAPCSLRVADDLVMSPGAGLSFAPGSTIDVTSHYEASWSTLLAQGLDASGLPADELQRQGMFKTVWVLRASGLQNVSMLPLGGVFSHTTRYSRQDYLVWSVHAAYHDATLEELQKTGTLFWSWLLAGRPELQK